MAEAVHDLYGPVWDLAAHLRATRVTTVRTARASEFGVIAELIARAFADDPVSLFLFPKMRTRARRLQAFYRFVLPLMDHHGAVYVDEKIRGSAIWQAPSPPRQGSLGGLVSALSMAVSLRGAMPRLMTLGRAVSSAHLREPHWYLGVLGTDPIEQGRGIGSSLLAPVLDLCDAEGLPAYLESSKERNIPFYQRHGFEITQEIQVPGGPVLWPMTRRPG